jgi:putative DNA methylase
MNGNDRRVIEDYIPLKALSEEGAREKKDAKGKIAAIHLWWARKPITSSRAAVYGALVPAPEGKNGRGGRSRFIAELCRYPGLPDKFAAAEEQILQAHATRLRVTIEEIQAGRAPRPRVLDPFAGGGSIPLEAARLGCEAFALDINPIAHLMELVTLDYARRYGPALAHELERWGDVILRRAKAEIGELYPVPDFSGRVGGASIQLRLDGGADDMGPAELMPVAYIWTRIVTCKRPDCGADVPLAVQSWLCRKKGRAVAVRSEVDPETKTLRFHVVEAQREAELGFDPSEGSSRGNAACLACRTVADDEYVKAEGRAGRIRQALVAVVCTKPGTQGKIFFAPYEAGQAASVSADEIARRIDALENETGLSPPQEPLPDQGTLGFRVQAYGLTRWRDLYTARQLLALLTFTKHIRMAHAEMLTLGYDAERARAVAATLTCVLDRLADFNSTLCLWGHIDGERVVHTFGRTALPMTWQYAESNPFNPQSASWPKGVREVAKAISKIGTGCGVKVVRGAAMELPFDDEFFDAVVTDPPYYDNVPYADLSDFFYVWARRAIGDLYPEHFATPLTPKRREAIAEPARHGGNKDAARHQYEEMMAKAFAELNRVLKAGAPLICVYAHKTVAGWSTLIDALRRARFVVVEAWPIDTEKPGRLRDQDSAALASSIFLVARRREGTVVGSYEREVLPELGEIVRERTETLWKEGVVGADLVIAAVGAGLRAFTRFERVEFENGQQVPADRFIREVEGAVLETVLRKIGIRDADPATKFYLAWRLQYGRAELDAGEAIVFAYPLGVELDGTDGLTAGVRALVAKKGKKMRLRDHTERGDTDKLGLPSDDGERDVALIDTLHRMLWLMEHRPGGLRDYLDKARPDSERLRVVVQALAGTALQGGEADGNDGVNATPEQSAARKLIANWRSVFEETLFSAPAP